MSNTIPLEGRTRLPCKIQDAIQDGGLIISQILSASRSNDLLTTAIKNFSYLDNTIEQSYANVKKMECLQDAMSAQSVLIENRFGIKFRDPATLHSAVWSFILERKYSQQGE